MASVKWTPEKGRKKVKGKIRWRVKRPDGTWQEHSATYSAKDGPDWQRQLHEHLARIEAGKDPTQAAPARSAIRPVV